MPSGDRTGPRGFGPRTGRGFGYCSGYPNPGFMTAGPGRGFGGGFGRGFGRGRGFGLGHGFRHPWVGRLRGYSNPPIHPYGYPEDIAGAPPFDEESCLVQEAKSLEEDLALINTRLEELKKSKPKRTEKKGNETQG